MKYSEDKYEARLAELFEKHQSVQSVGFRSDSYKPGLDNILRLDAAAGTASAKYRTIHVAGTNGKGSVCAMLASALAASGLKTGIYTSPHLLDFRERMRIVGEGMISREEVWDYLEDYETELEGLSFFEITTGMAFKWFADRGVDVAVIETGLGGRLDSTNIITPELSVITSIGLDHCAILGDTRARIAWEKAGIFKPAVPALLGFFDDETAPVFEEAAARVHCPLFFADDFGPLSLPEHVELDLRGPCQEMNLRTVLAALQLLGIVPDTEALAFAARRTGFRGRWEKLSDNPETICDIGHNPPALKLNFASLEGSGRPLVIVYGIMADKDLDGIAPMMPADAKYVLCAPRTGRAMPVEKLHERLSSLRPELTLHCASSVAQAVETAESMAADMKNSLIYIGGSTFVVSEAIEHIEACRH